ncbi:MAG: ABC transporter ATP-binding protein [Alphaproteobacteria bacterium]
MIQVIDLVKDFGGLHAVDGVSFEVEDGTITGLIGPNGAGKTTTFNMIAGSLSPTSGRVLFGDQRIDGRPTYEVFRRGLVRTFQIPRPFAELTVLENLMMVPKGQLGEKFWNTWLRPAGVRAQERELRDRAREILAFLQLEHLAAEAAKNLSGGQLKLLELGRALMSEPTTILLDEPGAGINPTLLAQIVDRIAELNQRGITFLIIEHNMDLVMNLCHPILVMANGKLLMQGDADSVRLDARVLEAFLGGVPE